MQDYLQRTRLAGALDEAGKLLVLLVFSEAWFIFWWGLSLRAVLAGLALLAILLAARFKTRGRRLRRREKRLRRAIGGEIALCDMLLTPKKRAHFQAALLLSRAYPVTLIRTSERGVLCEHGGEQLLAGFVQIPAALPLTARDIAAFQRACRASDAVRGVLLSAAEADRGAKEQAQLPPRVRVVCGKDAVALAGAAYPATDAQLAALAKQRRARAPRADILARMLDRKKTARYVLYGGGLACAYLATRQIVYAVSAALCLLLAALCLTYRGRREPGL